MVTTIVYCYSFFVFAGNVVNTNNPTTMLSEPVGTAQFFQMILGLLAVVIFIVGLAWLVKKMNNFQLGLQGSLKILCTISVSQREKIVLIQVGKQQLLIGVSPGQVQTLLVLEEAINVESIDSTKTSFSERLAVALKGKASHI